MNKTIKKFLIVVIIIIVLIIGWNISRVSVFVYMDLWKYNVEFENYKDEFVLIKKYIIDVSTNEDEKFLVLNNKDEKNYYLYSLSKQEKMNFLPEIEDALEIISKNAFSYKDSVLNVIEVQEEMVLFTIENGQYILAYSPDGRPNFEIEDKNIYVKKIEKGWYHISIR